MFEKAKTTYSRAEKRAFYIGMGAGISAAGDATARKCVIEKCGNTPEVIASYERGLHMGKTECRAAPAESKKAKSYDVDEFIRLALQRNNIKK